MSTGSTKSRNGKKKKTRSAIANAKEITGGATKAAFSSSSFARSRAQTSWDTSSNETESDSAPLSDRTWRMTAALILLLAAFFRLYDLTLKPLHHDEGVNGFFLTRLLREGIYRYDPANYHGPTIYYFAFVSSLFFGLTTFAVRLVPALFGLATVWLILLLKRHIGTVGSLFAAAFVAVSPGAVYMSRYFIHESLFVFFTLGIAYAALRYYEEGRITHLMLASASAALLFATKETAMISAGVFLIAIVSATIYLRLKERFFASNRSYQAKETTEQGISSVESLGAMLERLGGGTRVALWMQFAFDLFIFINILFYSSFFTHAKGLSDSLKTFEIWKKTGEMQHAKEWYKYLDWLWVEEPTILILGTLGVLLAFVVAKKRFPVFAALWTIGIISAYSIIKYKTPWLTLNFIIPLGIMSGYALNVMFEWGRQKMRDAVDSFGGASLALSFILGGAACVIATTQMVQLNFYHYDDNDVYPYVYAHTYREILPLLDEINAVAERTGGKEQTGIVVVSPEYWPLPWYLRDYKRVGFHGRIVDTNEPIVIASESQAAEVDALLGSRYVRTNNFYPLRPGVTLFLYLRKDIAPH